jgi:nucleotide-binding universal stress UspA family protein
MFEQVLVAVDGSGRSREMVNMLLPLPSMQSAQITVLHTIPVAASAEGLTEYRLAGERVLEKEVRTLRLNPTNTVVSLLREGDPKDIVCNVADDLKPDFLIMGSRGMGRIQAILANETSQYVFQVASVPMLLVKDDVYIKAIRHILLAFDNPQTAVSVLDFVLKFIAGSKNIEVTLLRVIKDENDQILKEATSKLERLGVKYRTITRPTVGGVGKVICETAEELNCGLLVLGSPERRPSIARSLPDLDRLFGSSVSDYVRVQATCPVMLVRTLL